MVEIRARLYVAIKLEYNFLLVQLLTYIFNEIKVAQNDIQDPICYEIANALLLCRRNKTLFVHAFSLFHKSKIDENLFISFYIEYH